MVSRHMLEYHFKGPQGGSTSSPSPSAYPGHCLYILYGLAETCIVFVPDDVMIKNKPHFRAVTH